MDGIASGDAILLNFNKNKLTFFCYFVFVSLQKYLSRWIFKH